MIALCFVYISLSTFGVVIVRVKSRNKMSNMKNVRSPVKMSEWEDFVYLSQSMPCIGV